MILSRETQLLILLALTAYAALAKRHNYEHDHEHDHKHDHDHDHDHHHSHDGDHENEEEHEYESERHRHNKHVDKHDDKGKQRPVVDQIKLSNGASYPLLGFGTITLNGSEIEKALDTALELGYRHIDTASVYGNEEIIGKVLKKWFSDGKLKREDIFVTTKLPRYGNKPELVSKYLEESLKNLQLDYVDLYMMQMPMYLPKDEELFNSDDTVKIIDVDLLATWEKMEAQVNAGKTKAIGVTSFNQSQILRIKKYGKILPAVLQTELQLYLQEKPLIDFCKNMGIAVTVLYPFQVIGGSYSLFFKSLADKQIPNVLDNQALTTIAKDLNKSAEQVLLRFFTQQSIAVIGTAESKEGLEFYRKIHDFFLSKREMHLLKEQDKWESGRIGRLSSILKGIEKHPEYPFAY